MGFLFSKVMLISLPLYIGDFPSEFGIDGENINIVDTIVYNRQVMPIVSISDPSCNSKNVNATINKLDKLDHRYIIISNTSCIGMESVAKIYCRNSDHCIFYTKIELMEYISK